MYIPFLHTESIGIALDDECVALHLLRGTRSSTRSVAEDREPLAAARGDAHAHAEALRALVDRNGLEGRVASILLPSHQGRFAVLSVPDVDDEAEGWIEDEAYRLLGASLPRPSVVIRFMPLGGEDGRVLVGCTRRESVEWSRDLLRSAGLIPSGIYLDAAVAGYGMILDQDLVDGESWVYTNGGVPVLARYAEGVLHDATELLQPDPSTANLQIEIRAMGSGLAGGVVHVLGRPPRIAADVDDPDSINVVSAPFAESMARAVAIAGRFGGLPRLDFLDVVESAEARTASEKRDFLLFFRPTAAVVLGVVLVILMAEMFVNARLAQRDAETADLRPLIAALESERAAVADLETRRRGVGEALAGRSQLAGVLDAVGGGIPPLTRLTALILEREGSAGRGEVWVARAAGVSSDPDAVMGMLARMESDPALEGVALRHTSRIEPVAPPIQPRIRFEVGYSVRPARFILSATEEALVDREAGDVESGGGGEQ